MDKLFAVFPFVKTQKPLIEAHCFGDCGKISLGHMESEYGPMLICTHEDCPHLDEQTDEPIGESSMEGLPVFVRKLK